MFIMVEYIYYQIINNFFNQKNFIFYYYLNQIYSQNNHYSFIQIIYHQHYNFNPYYYSNLQLNPYFMKFFLLMDNHKFQVYHPIIIFYSKNLLKFLKIYYQLHLLQLVQLLILKFNLIQMLLIFLQMHSYYFIILFFIFFFLINY